MRAVQIKPVRYRSSEEVQPQVITWLYTTLQDGTNRDVQTNGKNVRRLNKCLYSGLRSRSQSCYAGPLVLACKGAGVTTNGPKATYRHQENVCLVLIALHDVRLKQHEAPEGVGPFSTQSGPISVEFRPDAKVAAPQGLRQVARQWNVYFDAHGDSSTLSLSSPKTIL
jgi:hypothetical protein